MANQFFNIITFLMSLIIAETVIASPVGYAEKNFRNPLLQIVLESMNDRSPNNHHYQSGTLLEAKKISTGNDFSIYKVSVLLEPDCIEESLCLREICDMLIKEDESSNLIVDDKSKICHYDKNKPNFNHVAVKREASAIDVNDPMIANFVSSGTKLLDKFITPGKPLVTTMVNATKEEIADKTQYVIHFHIVEPTCTTSGITTSCSINDNSLARLCTVVVDVKVSPKFTTNELNATCEDEQRPLKD